jgi:hypothetical protein
MENKNPGFEQISLYSGLGSRVGTAESARRSGVSFVGLQVQEPIHLAISFINLSTFTKLPLSSGC